MLWALWNRYLLLPLQKRQNGGDLWRGFIQMWKGGRERELFFGSGRQQIVNKSVFLYFYRNSVYKFFYRNSDFFFNFWLNCLVKLLAESVQHKNNRPGHKNL